jgi:hypothetical protein
MKRLILSTSFALAACGGGERPATPSDTPTSYAVPVATGCVAEGGKPERPQTLKERYTAEQWAALPPGSKAEAIAAQAGKRLNYEDELNAATAGCK